MPWTLLTAVLVSLACLAWSVMAGLRSLPPTGNKLPAVLLRLGLMIPAAATLIILASVAFSPRPLEDAIGTLRQPPTDQLGQSIAAPPSFSHLSPEWIPFLDTHVLGQPIAYTDFSVKGAFVPDTTQGHESCLVGDLEQSVSVENRSDATVSYPITVYMSELTPSCQTVNVRRAEITRTGQPQLVFDAVELAQSMVDVSAGRVRYFRRPVILDPHQRIRVQFHVTVGALYTDRYSSRPRFPTTNMELVLSFPDDRVDWVQREWNHPLFRSDDDLDPQLIWTREAVVLPGSMRGTTYRLAVIGPVLPHNALEIRWFAKEIK